MMIDAVLEQLRIAEKHANEAAQAVDKAALHTDEAHTTAQAIGVRREAESIAHVQARLRDAVNHVAELRAILGECSTAAQELKDGIEPRLTSSQRPEFPDQDPPESSWPTYVAPLAALWSIATFTSIWWNPATTLWFPIYMLLTGALLASSLLTSRRQARKDAWILCTLLLIGAVLAPLIELLLRHSIATHRLIGFTLFASEVAVALGVYRWRKRIHMRTADQHTPTETTN